MAHDVHLMPCPGDAPPGDREERCDGLMQGMAWGLDLDIFHDIISGDHAGSMFATMEPPFLGTAKHTYAVLERRPSQGLKVYFVQSMSFLHRGSTIAAIKDSRCRSHRYYLLPDGFSLHL